MSADQRYHQKKVKVSAEKNIEIKPCLNCRVRQIYLNDCGYSSFNVSSVECANCGYEVDTHGTSDREKQLYFWNDEKRRLKQVRLNVIQRLQKLNMLINEDDAEI